MTIRQMRVNKRNRATCRDHWGKVFAIERAEPGRSRLRRVGRLAMCDLRGHDPFRGSLYAREMRGRYD